MQSVISRRQNSGLFALSQCAVKVAVRVVEKYDVNAQIISELLENFLMFSLESAVAVRVNVNEFIAA